MNLICQDINNQHKCLGIFHFYWVTGENCDARKNIHSAHKVPEQLHYTNVQALLFASVCQM